MDSWEQGIAKLLQSDYIEFSHKNISSSTNDGPVAIENYLELNVYNSKVIKEISFNERIMSDKCDEIIDSVLNFPSLGLLPRFDKITINFIETHGFFIFKSEKRNTVSRKATQ
jgi:hypothetical protein